MRLRGKPRAAPRYLAQGISMNPTCIGIAKTPNTGIDQGLMEGQKYSAKKALLAQMHMQWFAAEDEGRTEEPTEQKIRKAQDEGRFAKSSDLTGAIAMLFAVVVLGLMSSYSLNRLLNMLRFYFSRDPLSQLDGNLFLAFINNFLLITGPIMFAGIVGAVMASMLQTGGFRYSTKPIQPDFTKIAPNLTRWLSKSFGWPEGIFSLGKTLGKVSVVMITVTLLVAPDFTRLITLMRSPTLRNAFGFLSFLIFKILLLSSVIFLVIAIIDFIFQRRQYLDSLKMTKHEVKDEMRQSEGDPMVRSMLRRRMRELLQGNLAQSVPQADVVITNPTHYAVALQWDRESMEAPMLGAKGADEVAFRIRRIAEEHDIPIIENRPLARGLYDNVEVGEIIPERYWEVVSRVLAEVYRLKGKSL